MKKLGSPNELANGKLMETKEKEKKNVNDQIDFVQSTTVIDPVKKVKLKCFEMQKNTVSLVDLVAVVDYC